MDRTKLRVRLGDAEFESEGPADLVQNQFQSFLATLGSSRSSDEPTKPRARTSDADAPAGAAAESHQGPQPEAPQSERPYSEYFGLTTKGYLRVVRKPKPGGSLEDDQKRRLLLVLFGYAEYLGRPQVNGYAVQRAFEEAGFGKLERVDRLLGPDLVQSEGEYRGKTYSLKPEGKKRALEILQDLAE